MSDRILVPLDGSAHSERVVRVAVDLARARGAVLRLMHVVPAGSMPEGLERWAEIEHVRLPPSQLYEQEVGARILETFSERARELGAGEVETEIQCGDPARAILAEASRPGVSMVVLGSRGLSDLEGLVFGSVAHRVAHGAPCEVVTVR